MKVLSLFDGISCGMVAPDTQDGRLYPGEPGRHGGGDTPKGGKCLQENRKHAEEYHRGEDESESCPKC